MPDQPIERTIEIGQKCAVISNAQGTMSQTFDLTYLEDGGMVLSNQTTWLSIFDAKSAAIYRGDKDFELQRFGYDRDEAMQRD